MILFFISLFHTISFSGIRSESTLRDMGYDSMESWRSCFAYTSPKKEKSKTKKKGKEKGTTKKVLSGYLQRSMDNQFASLLLCFSAFFLLCFTWTSACKEAQRFFLPWLPGSTFPFGCKELSDCFIDSGYGIVGYS